MDIKRTQQQVDDMKNTLLTLYDEVNEQTDLDDYTDRLNAIETALSVFNWMQGHYDSIRLHLLCSDVDISI